MEDLGAAWIAAMRAGRFGAAWAISDRVLAARDPATRDDPAQPYHRRWVWDGRPFDGRDVLVRCYHGLGDTLQNARFLPLLAARCASLTVEVQPRLLPLLTQLGAHISWHPFDPAHPLAPSACDLEIMELPHALRRSPHDVPAPYLFGPTAEPMPPTLALCYAAGDWDPTRNVPAALFEPICRRWPTLTLVPEPTALPVLNPEGCALNFEETVRMVCTAQAVITVDTMIAHLAGALGKRTFLLLKHDPDWRWEPDACLTPWYGSMTVLGQDADRRWDGVVRRLEQELEALDRPS